MQGYYFRQLLVANAHAWHRLVATGVDRFVQFAVYNITDGVAVSFPNECMNLHTDTAFKKLYFRNHIQMRSDACIITVY